MIELPQNFGRQCFNHQGIKGNEIGGGRKK